MRSLFWTTFLHFFGTMVLMLGFGILLAMTSEAPEERRNREEARNEATAAGLVAAWEAGGEAALRQAMGKVTETSPLDPYVFDPRGRSLVRSSVPLVAQELAAAARAAGRRRTLGAPEGEAFWLAYPTTAGYVAVFALTKPMKFGAFFDARQLPLRLVTVLIITSGVCLLLARRLAAPILTLREATRAVARGQLSTRVAPEIGRPPAEILDLAKDFDHMTGRIQVLLDAQQRLLRDISHELRSPLARLNVALALAREQAGAGAEKSLMRIEREAIRMNDLIGQLRLLTLLETGGEHLEGDSLELKSLVEEVVADVDFEARSHGKRVKLVLAESVSGWGNRETLRQAVENVIRNAAFHTAKDTVVEVSLEQSAVSGKAEAVVKVRDRGPGVPEEELEAIFKPFYRVGEARDRAAGGTGIGLAITWRAVQAAGGSVRAQNAAEGGLEVTIRLPVEARG